MAPIDVYIERYGIDKLLSSDLTGLLRLQSREPGELIIRSGSPARELLFLVRGRAKVYRTLENGHCLLSAFYNPLEILGEVELFTSDRYSLSAQALSETICLVLPSEAVRKAADRNSRLLEYLCGRMGRKLTDRNAAEAINLRYPVEARLASYLLSATDRQGLLIGSDKLWEIADFLGASYRQLSRAVSSLREAGVLAPERGRIRVLDKGRLEALAPDRYDQGL